jgi:hypothetical protein
MTAARAIWMGLATLATAWGAMLGVPIGLSIGALACAVLPPLVGTFVRGSTTAERTAELESALWIVLATAAAASTGGASSSLVVMFIAGVAVAWTSGGARLTVEAAGFAVVGLAVAAFANARGSWLGPDDAAALEMTYGVASVAMVGIMAALAATSRAPALMSRQRTPGWKRARPFSPRPATNCVRRSTPSSALRK